MAPLFMLLAMFFSKLSYFCRTAFFVRSKHLQKVAKTPRFARNQGVFLVETAGLEPVTSCV